MAYRLLLNEAYEEALESWKAARLLDQFVVSAIPVTENAERKTYLKKVAATFSDILAIKHPDRMKNTITSIENTAADTDKLHYIELLGKKSFKSVDELLLSMAALSKHVQDKTLNAHTGSE